MKITLSAPLKMDGKRYEAGETIEVDDKRGGELLKLKAGDIVKPEKKADAGGNAGGAKK